MVQVWQSQSEVKVVVTHLAVDYTIGAWSLTVRRHENGFDTATLILEDTEATNYVDKLATDDVIVISQRDASEAWAVILNGVIRRVEPFLPPNLLMVECDGTGYGFDMTVCGQEYGVESSNPTLDTIKEMVEDATNGIVPKWVNKLLGTATDSGYAYTTQIETIAGSIQYLYFPFKLCDKSINDICDIVQAIKGASAGPHWIIDISKRLCLATVGAHGAPASTYWPTWWRTNVAGSTLVEGEDFKNFRFENLAKEANYILYHGLFKRPSTGDFWTNISSSLWGKDSKTNLANDSSAGNFKLGSDSVKADNIGYSPYNLFCWYPSACDLAWDVTKWGGKHNIPSLNVWLKNDFGTSSSQYLRLFMSTGTTTGISFDDYFYAQFTPSDNVWRNSTFQIGPYSRQGENATVWFSVGAPSWSNINYVGFLYVKDVSEVVTMWIDGLQFNGWILRGARQSAAFSATDPLKLKVITDNVAKDDSGKTDDSGTLGRLAKAELLRCKTTPIVGTFTIPIANDLLPGQLVHLHAKKQSSGAFRIDTDFRVLALAHNVDAGFNTTVEVTSDIINARARPLPTQLNTILGAVRPEFQDRQASSIKTREIDITQAILENSY